MGIQSRDSLKNANSYERLKLKVFLGPDSIREVHSKPGHYGRATLSFNQEIKYLEIGKLYSCKNVISSDQVVVHFNPNKPFGLNCGASNIGIEAVLSHRYRDIQIANVSNALTSAERNHNQIHKEALAIIFGLRKFHQYLYVHHSLLIIDH